MTLCASWRTSNRSKSSIATACSGNRVRLGRVRRPHQRQTRRRHTTTADNFVIVVFPSSDGSPHPALLKEQVLLEDLGIQYAVIDLAALVHGDADSALRRLKPQAPCAGVYRGWILHRVEYQLLYDALRARGVGLITSPAQYVAAQFLSEFFPKIADLSFPAAWRETTDAAEVQIAAQAMSRPPYFIKDFAKSAKEIWPRGCVVTEPGSVAQFQQAIDELREFRGDRFEGGIVVRPLLRLNHLGENPFGNPSYEEYRMVFVGRSRIATHAYDYTAGTFSDFGRFDRLGERIDSPFFTADCVVTEAGECLLLETNDGGSASMPPKIDLRNLYQLLDKVAANIPV